MGVQGVYTWLTGRPTPGQQAELLYNRDCSELRHKKDIVLHLGCNNWAGQKKEVWRIPASNTAHRLALIVPPSCAVLAAFGSVKGAARGGAVSSSGRACLVHCSPAEDAPA